MLLLMKLRTSACIVVGALCVLVSFVEPLRLIPYDMLAAVVVGIVAVPLVLRKRAALVQSEPEEEARDNEYEEDTYED